MIVTIVCHVFDSSVSIHVWAFVEHWLCVMCQGMCQHVHVQQASLVIHSSNAVKYQQRHHLDKMNIHAVHHHVDQIAIVAIIWVKLSARVNRTTSVHHHIVDQNVLSIRNAHWIEPVLITNVRMFVNTRAALVLFVMQTTIARSVLAHLDFQAIHSHNAHVHVSIHKLLAASINLPKFYHVCPNLLQFSQFKLFCPNCVNCLFQ